MKKKVRFSKRTTALIVAAVLLLAGGGVAGTRAALNIQSDYYRAQFYLNHLQVHLIENGKDVCERSGHLNDLNGDTKTRGALATSLEYSYDSKTDTETLGTVEPGMVYKEEVAAKNGSDIDEFVRITVRKYWMEPEKDKDGNVVKDENGDPKMSRSSTLSPDRIQLMFGGTVGYNTKKWKENAAEKTAESSTYYYRTDLSSRETSKLLFDQLKIDAQLVDLGTMKTEETTEGNKKVYTYTYQYEGATFYIEADVQAIQTHNVNEAIKSQWGVSNVTAEYNDPQNDGQGSGTLSVN